MQISNTVVSYANYTATSVKSGLSYGASTIGSLGRFGVSILKSGAFLTGKTLKFSANFFSGLAALAVKGVNRNPKISVTVILLAGAASIALVAKKRFNISVLEKLSSYSPCKGKKAEDATQVEEVKADGAEKVANVEEITAASTADAEDTPTEPESSPASSPMHEAVEGEQF